MKVVSILKKSLINSFLPLNCGILRNSCSFSISNSGSFTFYAIGDYGYPTPDIKQTAFAMSDYAISNEPPKFILALGDNFYPNGVQSVSDSLFKRFWIDVFLKYDSLRVPWRVVLGNHDYEGNAQAQIDYTNHESNPDKIWYCPSNNYEFSEIIRSSSNPQNITNVDFFALDTNGCQHQFLQQELVSNINNLNSKLNLSNAKWKIVFGHHPVHTKSRKHGLLGKKLGQKYYSKPTNRFFSINQNTVEVPGFGLEEILVKGKVDAYFTGHEHHFQHHQSQGVHHFIAGAAGYNVGDRLYGGPDPNNDINWVDDTNTDGFLAITVNTDTMVVKYISNNPNNSNKIVKIVELKK
eukprot:gene10456-14044_t